MKYFYKSIYLLCFLVFVYQPMQAQDSKTKAFEIAKNLDIYAQIFQKLNSNYVENIQAGSLNTAAIEAMLASLDPYTVFIPEAEIDKYELLQTGQFAGLGIRSLYTPSCVVVTQVLEQSPAREAGLRVGDSIFLIDDKRVSRYDKDKLPRLLKGQAGTKARLNIRRYGHADTLYAVVDRRRIKVPQVPYYGMLSDSVAYLKLNAFSKQAAQEVRRHLVALRQQGAKALVFDLRGNGGGLLLEAVHILNLFVPKGQEVVSMRSRVQDKNHIFTTKQSPLAADMPLVFLVNGRSASAAEILSGAAQDLDRAVIVGEQTFGKGLVQNIMPLSYGAQIKITTAKYYIPSGRCVQAIDYSSAEGHTAHLGDSTRAFYTRAGRQVFEGQGIQPDVALGEEAHLSPLSKQLKDSLLIFDYATRYAATHDSIAPPESFVLSAADWNDFVAFVHAQSYEYVSELALSLQQLQASIADNEMAEAEYDFAEVKKLIAAEKQHVWQQSKADIVALLQKEICKRYYYETGELKAQLPHDPVLKKAVELLHNKDAYRLLLMHKV